MGFRGISIDGEEIAMPRQVDAHVGQRIRHCRWIIGMTQDRLAHESGLTKSNIALTENGKRPLEVGELFEIAKAMDVPVVFFFEGLEGVLPDRAGEKSEVMLEREVMELVRAFYGLPAGQRKGLLDLAHRLSDTGE